MGNSNKKSSQNPLPKIIQTSADRLIVQLRSRSIIIHCGYKLSLNISDVGMFPHGLSGLKLWESNIILARYCVLNNQLFKNKKVMELDAGTGITGITIQKWTKCQSIAMSDSREEIITNMTKNCQSNQIKDIIIFRLNLPQYKHFMNKYDVIVCNQILKSQTMPLDEIYNLFKHFLNPNGLVIIVMSDNIEQIQQFSSIVNSEQFQFKYQKLEDEQYYASPLLNKVEGYQEFQRLQKEEFYVLKMRLKEENMKGQNKQDKQVQISQDQQGEKQKVSSIKTFGAQVVEQNIQNKQVKSAQQQNNPTQKKEEPVTITTQQNQADKAQQSAAPKLQQKPIQQTEQIQPQHSQFHKPQYQLSEKISVVQAIQKQKHTDEQVENSEALVMQPENVMKENKGQQEFNEVIGNQQQKKVNMPHGANKVNIQNQVNEPAPQQHPNQQDPSLHKLQERQAQPHSNPQHTPQQDTQHQPQAITNTKQQKSEQALEQDVNQVTQQKLQQAQLPQHGQVPEQLNLPVVKQYKLTNQDALVQQQQDPNLNLQQMCQTSQIHRQQVESLNNQHGQSLNDGQSQNKADLQGQQVQQVNQSQPQKQQQAKVQGLQPQRTQNKDQEEGEAEQQSKEQGVQSKEQGVQSKQQNVQSKEQNVQSKEQQTKNQSKPSKNKNKKKKR